jgi:hypothetical protein
MMWFGNSKGDPKSDNTVGLNTAGVDDGAHSGEPQASPVEADNCVSKSLDDIGELLVQDKVFAKINYRVYYCSVRKLAVKVDNWAFNRNVSEVHIESIKRDILGMEKPHLLGSIKLVRHVHLDEFRVIDGQHRLLAIRDILEKDETMEWDMCVLVEVYEVNDLNDPNVIDLYLKANNNLNVKDDDKPDTHLISIINTLCSDQILGSGIIDVDDNKKINKPRITKKGLFEAFKEYYHPTFKQDPVFVLERVKEINRKLGVAPHKVVFGKISEVSVSTQRKKADELKFYLNMKDSKFLPCTWIPMIYSGKELSFAGN